MIESPRSAYNTTTAAVGVGSGTPAEKARNKDVVVIVDANVLVQDAAREAINPERLYAWDDVDQSLVANPTGRSFSLACADIHYALIRFKALVDEGDRFGADIQLMNAKKLIYALVRFQHIGEGVALVVSWLAKATNTMGVATEAASAIDAIITAILTLKRSPNASFETAMEIVDRLEDAVGELPSPMYESVSELLTGNESEYESVA